MAPLRAIVGACVVLALLAARRAEAQGPPSSQPSFEREGFVIGLGTGIGRHQRSGDLDEYARVERSYELHVGAMLTPRLALFASMELTMAEHDGFHYGWLGSGGALRWFAADRLWLQCGLGGANYWISDGNKYSNEGDYHVAGAMVAAAAGVEVARTRSLAVAISVRGSVTMFDVERIVTYSANAALTWY